LKRRIREISEVIRQTPHRAPFEGFGRFSEIRSAGQISERAVVIARAICGSLRAPD
jgi:hypothetical protein